MLVGVLCWSRSITLSAERRTMPALRFASLLSVLACAAAQLGSSWPAAPDNEARSPLDALLGLGRSRMLQSAGAPTTDEIASFNIILFVSVIMVFVCYFGMMSLVNMVRSLPCLVAAYHKMRQSPPWLKKKYSKLRRARVRPAPTGHWRGRAPVLQVQVGLSYICLRVAVGGAAQHTAAARVSRAGRRHRDTHVVGGESA